MFETRLRTKLDCGGKLINLEWYIYSILNTFLVQKGKMEVIRASERRAQRAPPIERAERVRALRASKPHSIRIHELVLSAFFREVKQNQKLLAKRAFPSASARIPFIRTLHQSANFATWNCSSGRGGRQPHFIGVADPPKVLEVCHFLGW